MIISVSIILLTAVFYYGINEGRLFADVPISGDLSEVKLKQIPLFSNLSGEETSEVNLTLARGQKESFEVVLENGTEKTFNDLTVYKENLISSTGNVISKNNIDERVVHNWQQRVIIPGATFRESTFRLENLDELLVKNDKTDFFSNDIGQLEDSLLSSSGSRRSSNDPSSEPISLSMEPDAKRKFVFSVTVPVDKTGHYEGNVQFVDSTKNQVIKSLKLKVDILGTDLILPSDKNGQTIGCFVNDQIKPTDSVPSSSYQSYMISEQNFTGRMKAAKEIGCESLVLRFGGNDINKMLSIVSSLGFKGPIILNYYYMFADGRVITSYESGQQTRNDLLTLNHPNSEAKFKKIVEQIKNDPKISVPIMFYGLDEPNINSAGDGNKDKFEAHKQRVSNITRIIKEVYGDSLSSSNMSAKVASAANVYASRQIFDLGEEFFSGITIEGSSEAGAAGNFSDRLREVSQGSNLLGNENYYFQGWKESPAANRFRSGFGYINTGLSGFFVNTLHGYYNANSRPIYLEDDTHPVDSSNNQPFMKQMLTVYPAYDGFIPTVQSEGLREGVLDLKYYLTFKVASENISKCSADKAAQLRELADRINKNLKQYDWINSVQAGGEVNIPAENFELTRTLIKQYLNLFENSCNSNQLNFSKGFTLAPSRQQPTTSDITKKGMSVFTYNASAGKWLIAPRDKVSFDPGVSYYIRNTSSQKETIDWKPPLKSFANRPLNKGWNLISSSQDLKLSNIETVVNDKAKNCIKTVSLQALTNLGYGSKKVYIVVDDKATVASNAFKLYGNGTGKLDYIPKEKGFWYYLHKKPLATDKELKVFDCR